MTPLRQRMSDAMLQRGLSACTRDSYIGAIYRMARYYRRDPAEYTAAEVQAYLLHLVKDRNLAYSTMNVTACASRFLYETVLNHECEMFHIPMAKVPAVQPGLLSRNELARLFAACSSPVHRMLLQTMYATGLRVSEACALRVEDIDSAPGRMCIRVEHGKGGHSRYTILSVTLLAYLRAYVRGTTSRDWLFCNQRNAQPVSVSRAQQAYYGARSLAGITKSGGIHTLRHDFASHLLEGGVDLFTIQKLMGHAHIGTTSRYLRLISPQFRPPKSIAPLDLLAGLPKL
ncbi:tyrosine-type recombinase/integrase [Massilia sp. TSP1-1-2]|uniref:tyrosine-type recombinase/integrase n=1 Tax=Massilia sp. TSP1-1-2 TaxID=2804649 RepID=UPI003CFA2512